MEDEHGNCWWLADLEELVWLFTARHEKVLKQSKYPEDVYDRIWTPYSPYGWKQISTTLAIDNQGLRSNDVPSIVLRTAATPMNGNNNMEFSYQLSDGVATFYVCMYFAEIEKPQANQTRKFNIYVNGRILVSDINIPFLGFEYFVAYPTPPASKVQIWLNRTNTSTIAPLLNGIEVYKTKVLNISETYQNDVDAIMQIKSTYGIKRNWQGDPCTPKDYMWNGLNCLYGENQPAIISLNLSLSGLTGSIASGVSNLLLLQYLDLSNNSLTGSVPDLSQLKYLKVLNIEGNELSGLIPANLMQRSMSGSLRLSFGANPDLCTSSPCPKGKKVVIPLVVTLVGAFILSAVSLYFYRSRLQVFKSKKKLSCTNKIVCVDSNKQEFTYSEILSITNNLERVVGKGGVGTVYHGYIGETQVAVKLLSPSTQGHQQFHTEAEILTRVHHKCLTPLIGYCNEGTKTALIYEYMSNGNLAEYLSDESQNLLGWKQRLQIALDSAVGLEYLHNGCKPPIVHRDIKTSNILLNEQLRGKISDFGLSRIFPDECDYTHVTTRIAGTPGYVDPEYYISNRLTEKSDVFSFGVVLLEIITGRAAIFKGHEKTHIIQWLNSTLGDEGEIDSIMDPRLQGGYNSEAARKVADLAMACVAPNSINRPTMNKVVIELKQCLPMGNLGSTSSSRLIDFVSVGAISGESSLER